MLVECPLDGGCDEHVANALMELGITSLRKARLSGDSAKSVALRLPGVTHVEIATPGFVSGQEKYAPTKDAHVGMRGPGQAC